MDSGLPLSLDQDWPTGAGSNAFACHWPNVEKEGTIN